MLHSRRGSIAGVAASVCLVSASAFAQATAPAPAAPAVSAPPTVAAPPPSAAAQPAVAAPAPAPAAHSRPHCRGWYCRHPLRTGDHMHDGFLLRVMLPFSWLTLVGDSGSRPSRTITDTGGTIGTSLDVGAAVIENFIVRGRLGWSASGRLHDRTFGRDIGVLLGDIGVGADYYLLPINMYFGMTLSVAGIAFAHVSRNDDHPVRHSRPGAGLAWDVGKEWWVGRNWGIGFALRLSYVNVAPANLIPSSDGRLAAWSIGSAFSATFN